MRNIWFLSPLVLSKWENLALLWMIKLKNTHTFLKKYTNWAKPSSFILTEQEETKTRYFAPRYHYLFQAMYADGIFEEYERNTTLLTNRIKATFAHLKAQFCHPSLGTKFNINLQNPNDPIPCCGKSPDGTDRIGPKHLVEEILEEDSSTHLVVYFTAKGMSHSIHHNNIEKVEIWGLEVDFCTDKSLFSMSKIKEIGDKESYYSTKISIFPFIWAGLAALHKISTI